MSIAKLSLFLFLVLPTASSFATGTTCNKSPTKPGHFVCNNSQWDKYTTQASCLADCNQCPGLINKAANAESACKAFDTKSASYNTPACSGTNGSVDEVQAYEKVCGKYMLTASQNAIPKGKTPVVTAKTTVKECKDYAQDVCETSHAPQPACFWQPTASVCADKKEVVAAQPVTNPATLPVTNQVTAKTGPCEVNGVAGTWVGNDCKPNAQNGGSNANNQDPPVVSQALVDGSVSFEKSHQNADGIYTADIQATAKKISENPNLITAAKQDVANIKDTKGDYASLRKKVISGDVSVSYDADQDMYHYTDTHTKAEIPSDKFSGVEANNNLNNKLNDGLVNLTAARDQATAPGATAEAKNTFNTQKGLTGTDKTAVQAELDKQIAKVDAAKDNAKADQATLKRQSAEKNVDAGKAKAIMETGTAEGDDAHYGHHATGSTETNLQTTAMAQTMINTVGQGMVSRAGGNAQTALIQKGASATQTDYINAQKSAAKASIVANTTSAGLNVAAAMMQYNWASNHRKDANDTTIIAGRAKTDLNGMNYDQKGTGVQSYDAIYKTTYGKEMSGHLDFQYEVCKNDADKASRAAAANHTVPTLTSSDCLMLKKYNPGKDPVAATSALRANSKLTAYVDDAHKASNQSANEAAQGVVSQTITTNSTTEQKTQTAMAQKAAAAAIQSAAGAATAAMNAIATKDAMNNLTTTPGGGFAFNPGTGNGYGDDGTAGEPAPVSGAIVDSQATDDALKNADQFNPGADGGVGGDAAKGAFAPGSLAGAGAPNGGAGGGLSTGGTSAAKDDGSAKDNTPPGKSSVGSYSAGDNTAAGTYSRNTGGGNNGVGMDNSFADLLKKFLPGGDEEKKNGEGAMAFDQDRNPASDAAAVLGRNKNIFDEIHKRYEKKNSEGAIVF